MYVWRSPSVSGIAPLDNDADEEEATEPLLWAFHEERLQCLLDALARATYQIWFS